MSPDDRVNILLVDDRPENLLVLRSTLAKLDENLIEANSGREALERVADTDFAVILLDVMMPDLDGFETARLIRERERSRHTPIIFVTAMYLNDSDAFRGYAVGGVDYIMKPFVPDILRSKVSVFVELFRKTEELRRQQEQIRLLEQREYLDKLLSMETKLREEEQRRRAENAAVRSVFEHAPVGLARLNTNLELVDVNEVFLEQFSLPADVIGAPITDKLPGLPEAVVEAIRAMRPHREDSLFIGKSQAGDVDRYCDLAVWPTEALEGEHTGTILVAAEVTERMLRDLQKQDFVATLAHDLQTPVIASDRALSLLLAQITTTLSPNMIQLASMLKQNNKNLLRMIEGLLDLYHYEEGARALYCDDIDLNALASNCVDELLPLARERGLQLSAALPPAVPCVHADRTAIRRVLTNLLDNSIKFTQSGGRVTIKVSAAGDKVIVEVEDDGIGVKPEDKDRLFDRYWHGQGHETFKSSSGLGLYVCKQIVQAHRGTIECESAAGKMTVFRVVLPVSAAALSQDKTGSEATSSTTSKLG